MNKWKARAKLLWWRFTGKIKKSRKASKRFYLSGNGNNKLWTDVFPSSAEATKLRETAYYAK